MAALMTAYMTISDNPLSAHQELNTPQPSILYAGMNFYAPALNSEIARRMNTTLVLCQEGVLAYIKIMPKSYGERLQFLTQNVKDLASGLPLLRYGPRPSLMRTSTHLALQIFRTDTQETHIYHFCPLCLIDWLVLTTPTEFIASYRATY